MKRLACTLCSLSASTMGALRELDQLRKSKSIYIFHPQGALGTGLGLLSELTCRITHNILNLFSNAPG
jgi:hypothetical protein